MSTDDLLSYAEIAPLARVTPATLRNYRAQGLMPPPDDASVPDRPRWQRSTITTWLANRPGRGRRRSVPYVAGVPSAGHVVLGSGAWHPGSADSCSRCEQ